ncbi:MAG: UPF0158 family protein [Anaerolineae bacterium]|nr:UPF0158 family protein [Anaerolineae bacterium]
MKKLKIKLDSLMEIFGSSDSYDWMSYLNIRTGETELVSRAESDNYDTEDYIQIPMQDTSGYKTMQEFIETIKDANIRELLWVAIDGSGAFRRFKGVIYDKGLSDKWYQFRDTKKQEQIIEWLNDNDIEPEFV